MSTRGRGGPGWRNFVPNSCFDQWSTGLCTIVVNASNLRRPGGVTVVVVLTYISGILSVLGGLLIVLVSRNTSVEAQLGAGSGVLLAAGILSMIIGVVTILVARGLRHGRRTARLVVTVVMALQIITSVVALFSGTSQTLAVIVQILVSAVAIALLWSGAAKPFFAH